MKDLKKLIEAIRTDYVYGFLAWEVLLMVGLALRNIERYFYNSTLLFYGSNLMMTIAMVAMAKHVFFNHNNK